VLTLQGGVENFQVVAVAKMRGKLDKAFSTDITMSIEGRKVEITGNITRYKGKAAGRKGKIELVVGKVEQIKVVD
jgi:DNA/RNA endonuclease YhcR with UshA esterase domain